MSIAKYTSQTFIIANEDSPEYADAYNDDRLAIREVPRGSGVVKFEYAQTTGNTPYRGSWATAIGFYDDRRDMIYGSIQVQPFEGDEPVAGWFSIALDRDLTYADRVRIHVYVQTAEGGAPDEGSFTGQGN